MDYGSKAEKKKLYSKLVREYSKYCGLPQRQIRKIASDFFKLGIADAETQGVEELTDGTLRLEKEMVDVAIQAAQLQA